MIKLHLRIVNYMLKLLLNELYDYYMRSPASEHKAIFAVKARVMDARAKIEAALDIIGEEDTHARSKAP
jgi:hypothetical protein